MNNQNQTPESAPTQGANLECGLGSVVEIAKKELPEIITPAQLRLILITREMHEETIHLLTEFFEHVLL